MTQSLVYWTMTLFWQSKVRASLRLERSFCWQEMSLSSWASGMEGVWCVRSLHLPIYQFMVHDWLEFYRAWVKCKKIINYYIIIEGSKGIPWFTILHPYLIPLFCSPNHCLCLAFFFFSALPQYFYSLYHRPFLPALQHFTPCLATLCVCLTPSLPHYTHLFYCCNMQIKEQEAIIENQHIQISELTAEVKNLRELLPHLENRGAEAGAGTVPSPATTAPSRPSNETPRNSSWALLKVSYEWNLLHGTLFFFSPCLWASSTV